MAHKSPLNARFVADYQAAYPGAKRPNFLSVSAYDAMAAIFTALEKTGGKADSDSFIAALKGLELESPRGPIEIDAQKGTEVSKAGDPCSKGSLTASATPCIARLRSMITMAAPPGS